LAAMRRLYAIVGPHADFEITRASRVPRLTLRKTFV
jgi:hypothetical protein